MVAPSTTKKFKVRLRQWRIGRALRQKEAAAIIGVSLGVYRSWEDGRRTPKSKTLLMDEILRRMG